MPLCPQHAASLALTAAMVPATLLVLSARPIRHDRVEPRPITYRIDLNHADEDTLCLLPGVGPGIARRIITHRGTHGPFHSAAAVEEVPLIGEKKRMALEPWVLLD